MQTSVDWYNYVPRMTDQLYDGMIDDAMHACLYQLTYMLYFMANLT